ncbi:MAG: histidine phosphatase family protein [Acidimicrobiia bacterium]
MAGVHDIVLARHGETEWSASGRHTSFTDVALTARGREQAAALRGRLARWSFAAVLTSPRRRARDTCELAGVGAQAEVDDDLAEWDYGEYEGRTTPEIHEQDPGWTIFTGNPPGGETAAQVGARADRVLSRAAAVDGPVALFSHGHFLRVLGARWVALDAADGRLLGLDTATLSVLGHERDQRVLRMWNSGGGDAPVA